MPLKIRQVNIFCGGLGVPKNVNALRPTNGLRDSMVSARPYNKYNKCNTVFLNLLGHRDRILAIDRNSVSHIT